ncbi:MAG: tetratricopeptide repeat protein [Planctomycetota bacterium]
MNLWTQQHAAALVDRAGLALDACLLDEASADLDAAIRLDPGHADALQMRLTVDLMLGRCEHALAVADQLAAYHPELAQSPAVGLSIAEAHARAGRVADATDLLTRLTDRHPDQPDAWRALAGALLRLGQDEASADALDRLIELEPDNGIARRQLARVIGHRDPQRAIELLRWPGHGDDPVVLLDCARLCMHVDRLRDAQDLLDRVMLEHGDDPAACIETGNLADRFGDRAAARALLEFAAATRGSHQPDALAALAIAHLHAGAFAAAATVFRRLTRRADRDSDAHRLAEGYAGLTVAALSAGRDRLATRARRRLLTTVHGDEAAARTAVATAWRHAAAARVIDATRRATDAGNASDTATNSPGADSTGRPPASIRPLLARAVAALRQSADAHPDRADTLYHLAVCEHELGHDDTARSALDRALRANPHYAQARRLSMQLGLMRRAGTTVTTPAADAA